MALLEVDDLSVTFARRGQRTVRAVDGVSFSVDAGDVVGLVGESGCGKSVTSLAIMGLLPKQPGLRVGGKAMFDGTDLLQLDDRSRRDIRGRDIAMIFQDPLSSLNPVVPIGLQVTEVLTRHRGMKGDAAAKEAAELLDRVGIPDPKRRLKEYPHQLSGGMRQRALIAMAVACQPRLLIADEPTTALDVTIQAQILELLKDLVRGSGTALVMITHDLGVVAGMCDTVNVLYGGRVVETARRRPLFREPRHPYTVGLLASVPRLDAGRGERLNPIPGSVRDLLPWPEGCAFAPRCTRRVDACVGEPPDLVLTHDGRSYRCINPAPLPGIVPTTAAASPTAAASSIAAAESADTADGDGPAPVIGAEALDAGTPAGGPVPAPREEEKS
ncbi:peptide/nickel transport system ATP-binding protein [Micromonospora phaseoli]|uniref:Peptide/nickel transport system ATP-binding protein n=1 Tax=Micromonospora phaseoli TaxID=1144548 RepID=A0A1H7DLA2_9ACTN|nr:ABC transporter ATP-binding protein [Micromonospora phaseoli]PZV90508.1 peptide/nickel transport system ATP-binding protein [Micromonospora phaseoli]GIJ78100.1 dipeptide/oligopeptide/nickel ABC transporter ATP-binding protein [Micromonospora phaseoli]SEK00020.1 peptide/nickel transport system ATP-binding protein [Micromonospora phaseoli]